MEKEYDARTGIYVNYVTGKVLLQLQNSLPLAFDNLNAVGAFLDYLDNCLEATRDGEESRRRLRQDDDAIAIEELERLFRIEE